MAYHGHIMKALLQRVSQAEVRVDGAEIARIGPGLLVFLCVEDGDGDGDGEADAELLARKVANLRIFDDDAGRMNRSVRDTGGGVHGGQPVHPGRRLAQGQPPQLLRRRRARPGTRALPALLHPHE